MLKLNQPRRIDLDKLFKPQARFKFSLHLYSGVWVVIAGYFGLTVLFTFPLVLDFAQTLPGQLLEDRDQNLWNLWWVKEAVLNFRNPFHTDYIYYPVGVSLYFHTLHPLNGLLSLPVQLLFGSVVAYNFIVFFSFVLAGLGTYLLLVYLCENRPAAFVASLIFVFAPYHLGTLKGLVQLISLEWIPFYVLYLFKASAHLATGRQRLRYSLSAALFLGFTALTDWYYTLFLIGFSLLYFVWLGVSFLAPSLAITRLRWRSPKYSVPEAVSASTFTLKPPFFIFRPSALARFWPFGLILVIFLVGMSPILLAMWREMNATAYYLPDPQDTRKYSADLLAFFLPPTTSSFFSWVEWRNFDIHYITGPLASQVYLGYCALGLSILGLFISKATRFWGFAGFCFWVLALGPALRVNGPTPGWSLPYALIENWPIIRIMRSPDRFVVITMLCLAVCASFGLKWLVEWLRRGGHPTGSRFVLGIVVGLLIAELVQVPYPVNPYQISPFFEQLGRDQEDYTILELPPQGGLWSGAPRMAEQAVHHKRIFDGYISREYDHPFQRSVPGFKELVTLKFNADIVKYAPQGETEAKLHSEWYTALNYYRVRYIILRSAQTTKQSNSTKLADYRAAIKRIVPSDPIYQDAQLEVYAVPSAFTVQPFVEVGEGWYEPEASGPPSSPSQDFHRWAWGKANLNIVWPGQGPKKLDLSLTLGLLQPEREARLLLNGLPVWSRRVSYPQTIKVPLALNPGNNRLEIQVDGKPATPTSLGIGNDLRRLLYYVSDVTIE